MIRFIIAVTFLVIYLIVTLPFLFVAWLLKKPFRHAMDIAQLRVAQFAFKGILFICGTKLTILGEENIPTEEPVLYVGNHRSFFDVVISYTRCKHLTGYVSKDSMQKAPILSIWMKRLYCLFLNRDDIREGLKTILTGIEQMKQGISMCIYPEGTRGRGETELEMLPFKEGSLKMAEKTGYAIIPMAITGSADIFENHFPKIKPTHVILQYGAPIYPKDLSREDQKHLGHYTQNQILSMLEQAKLLQV